MTPGCSRGNRRLLPALFVMGVVAVLAPAAAAQPREPLPLLAVDLHGALPKLPTDPALASARGIPADTLPAWGPGLNVGAHVYPLRTAKMTLGFGVSLQWLRGSDAPEVPEGANPAAYGPAVTTRFTAIAPQASLNFGHRRGWSYLSAGLGPATLTVSRDDQPDEQGEAVQAFNYGGGARWFAKPRLAFSFDLRIFKLPSLAPGDRSAGHPTGNVIALNLGVSFQ